MPTLDDLDDTVELSPLLGSASESDDGRDRGGSESSVRYQRGHGTEDRVRINMSGRDNSDARGGSNSTPARRPRSRQGSDTEDDEGEGLVYGAAHVIMLFIPVSICMAVVVITVESVKFYTDQSDGVYLIYAYYKPEAGDTAGETFSKSLQNALIIIGVVIVMTLIIIVLYKYRCYKIIHGWLLLSSLLLVFFFSYIYFGEVLKAYNLPLDYITTAIFIWNFGSVGLVSLHWKGPLIIQQAYCIMVSALMALVFLKYLPEWTAWMVLVLLAIWDLVAVLCPKGPLRILVETAQERDEPLFPSLIYSSTVLYSFMLVSQQGDGADDDTHSNSERSNIPRQTTILRQPTDGAEEERNADDPESEQSCSSEEGRGTTSLTRPAAASTENTADANATPPDQPQAPEQRGVKLGLGDFIFYSLLIGRASSTGDWNTTIACFVAILIGLCFTLVLLAVFRKALPALPISIAFGLVFNFATAYVISPFATNLSASQLYI